MTGVQTCALPIYRARPGLYRPSGGIAGEESSNLSRYRTAPENGLPGSVPQPQLSGHAEDRGQLRNAGAVVTLSSCQLPLYLTLPQRRTVPDGRVSGSCKTGNYLRIRGDSRKLKVHPRFWCLGRRRVFQHFFRMSQATTRQFNIRVKWSGFSWIHLWKKPTTP